MPHTMPPSVRPSIAGRAAREREQLRAGIRADARRVAEHEAAHLVTSECCELERNLAAVVVIGGRGECFVGRPPGGASNPEAMIAAFLGGLAWDMHRGHADTLRRSERDIRQATRFDFGDEALFRAGLDRALGITSLYAPAIRHLADAIERSGGYLAGDALDQAITAAMGAQPRARLAARRDAVVAIRTRELFDAALRELPTTTSLTFRGATMESPLSATERSALMASAWDRARAQALAE